MPAPIQQQCIHPLALPETLQSATAAPPPHAVVASDQQAALTIAGQPSHRCGAHAMCLAPGLGHNAIAGQTIEPDFGAYP